MLTIPIVYGTARFRAQLVNQVIAAVSSYYRKDKRSLRVSIPTTWDASILQVPHKSQSFRIIHCTKTALIDCFARLFISIPTLLVSFGHVIGEMTDGKPLKASGFGDECGGCCFKDAKTDILSLSPSSE